MTAEHTPGYRFSKRVAPPSTADDTTSRNFALQTMNSTVISLDFPQGEGETNWFAKTNGFLRGIAIQVIRTRATNLNIPPRETGPKHGKLALGFLTQRECDVSLRSFSIDSQGRADDVRSIVRTDEDDGICDFLRRADSLVRN